MKHFSLLVTNKDLDAIDDKSSVFKEQSEDLQSKGFTDFELEVGEADWLATRHKLENEKLAISKDNSFGGKFTDFEIQPDDKDWQLTYNKYRSAKRRRVVLWWWLSTGIVVLSIGLGILMSSKPKQDNSNAPFNVSVSQEKSSESSRPNSSMSHGDITKDNKVDEVDIAKEQGRHDANNNSKAKKDNAKRSLNQPVKSNLANNNSDVKKTLSLIEPKESMSKPEKPGFNDMRKPNLFDDLKKPLSVGQLPLADSNSLTNQEKDSKVVEGEEDFIAKSPDRESESDVLISDSSKTEKEKEEPENPKTGFKPARGYYLAIVNQAAYTSRYLSRTNNAFYNSIRQSADKSFLQYFAGLEFGRLSEKSRFNLGIHASTQFWRSDYKFSYKVYDSLPFKDPQGNVIGYFLSRARDTAIDESHTIKVSRIELPFDYHVLKQVNNKLQISAGLGAVLGLSTQFRGDKILYPLNQQLSHYQRWKDIESTISFAPSLHAGIQYRIAEKWMIQTNVFGNMYLNSRFRPEFNVKDYPYSIGLNLKLMYLLNH